MLSKKKKKTTVAAVKFPRVATSAALQVTFAQGSDTQFASGAYDGVVRARSGQRARVGRTEGAGAGLSR